MTNVEEKAKNEELLQKQFFENRGKNSDKYLKQIIQSYSEIQPMTLNHDLSDELILNNNNVELIWQQLSLQNSAFMKKIRKISKLLEEQDEIEDDNDEFEDEESVDENAISDSTEAEDQDDGDDLFALNDEDLKNLDAQLKALDNDDDEKVPRKKRKVETKKRSEVDDDFFNLEEMNNFLDEQDKVEDVMVTDDEDDDADFETDYKYTDFFENDSKNDTENTSKSDNKKRVSFAPDVEGGDESEDDEDMDDEEDDEIDGPVLLGLEEEKKRLTTHTKTKKKIEETIDRIQRENLNPRSWELSGEVTADSRSKDSLLEKFIEVDFRQHNPPINTQEKSDKIMAISLKRFKEKLFDDVERKYKDDNTVQPYRNMIIDMTERKTLTEVYEDKYYAALNGEDKLEDIDPQTQDIQLKMSKLFEKLDALTHLNYTPSRVTEEIKIVKNMPSMRVEEVGPLAAAGGDETTLAPEEIARHIKSVLTAKEERTKTDKKRERRKKKVKQNVLAKLGKLPKIGKEKQLEEQIEKANKSNKKTKNTDFFGKMQDLAIKQIKEKANGGKLAKKRKIKDRSETAAKYKA